MVVHIIANLPYLQHLNGKYRLEQSITVINWLEGLGVKWDVDALVILNGRISRGDEILQDQDQIQLLVPISGG
ncbi:MoaD/ThiS family protein [Tepidibacillus fermentans]|uniref:ThiS family protein n=1 Tax=Tepidibacillus fermentans TaxID=1281767 RepID=A0A4R3KIQ7_9BACI|nr:MoaD/ThiS family protein [Tepidibacillus fermentans]TCS83164.1 ThiS family protein [Tepidibacillus fermentans]